MLYSPSASHTAANVNKEPTQSRTLAERRRAAFIKQGNCVVILEDVSSPKGLISCILLRAFYVKLAKRASGF